MKKSKASALLDQAILGFGDELADLLFEAQLLVHTYKVARSGETITFDERTKRYTHGKIVKWFNSCLARDLTHPQMQLITLGGRHGDRDSITQRFPSTLNAQLRWLLVSAYEAYERYLRDFYAVLGYCDSNLWRLSDFGSSHTIKDVSRMSLNDFRALLREPGNIRPKKIRTLLAHRFGNIQRFQSRNSIDFGEEAVSHKEYIDLIEILRHVIVHEDSHALPDNFFDRLQYVWKRTDSPSPKLRALILHTHFRKDGLAWEVWLAEDSRSPVSDTHARPFGMLVERLGSHACLLYKETAAHFGHKAFWEKERGHLNHRLDSMPPP